jgi:hypothetical protein
MIPVDRLASEHSLLELVATGAATAHQSATTPSGNSPNQSEPDPKIRPLL